VASAGRVDQAITTLNPTQISALPPAAVASIPADQISTLKVDQVAALQPAQVTSLQAGQVSALRPDQVSALSGAQIGALQPAQIATLRPDQVSAIQPNLVTGLRPEQLVGLKTDQVAALRVEQVAALRLDQVEHLTPAQMAALRPEQIAALPPDARDAILKALGRAVPASPANPATPASPAGPAIPAVPASPAVPPIPGGTGSQASHQVPVVTASVPVGEQVKVAAPLTAGGEVKVAVGAKVLQAVQAAQPEVAAASIVIDPAPAPANPVPEGVIGNGRIAAAPGLAPVDVLLQLRDAAGNAVKPAASADATSTASPAGTTAIGTDTAAAGTAGTDDAETDAGDADPSESVVLVRLPLGQPSEPGAEFHWLHEVLEDGVFQGYTWSPDEVVDEETGTVTIPMPVSALQGTLFVPASITPGYVANYDPLVHMWSGPTREARDFGFAGPQFTTFPVLAPQVGLRLFVFSPVVNNYAWVDAMGVGPVGDPDA
jgi:hypothetical protein